MNLFSKNNFGGRSWARLLLGGLLLLALADAPHITQAQTAGPTYTVQPGDTLFNIAREFGVSLADLQKANNLTDPTKIAIGQQLILPGFEGISGKVASYKVKPGETFAGIVRRLGMNYDLAVKLNRLTNPSLLYLGQRLTYIEGGKGFANGRLSVLQPNESMLTLAGRSGKNVWELALLNEVKNPYVVAPGQQVITPVDGVPFTGLPTPFDAIVIKPERIFPGGMFAVTAQVNEDTQVQGQLGNWKLKFAPESQGHLALQGIDRWTDLGLYPLTITATTSSGLVSVFEQMIPISDGNYPQFQLLNVGEELKDLLDANLRKSEFEKVQKLAAVFSPTREWQGLFKRPIQSERITTLFGILRSYNGGPLDTFHGGIDYGADGGAPITAPANGTILYVGEMKVRGRVTLIDHGWGVITGYWHQYKIHVQVGQKVKAGDLIGEVGSSGLSTGPHLHFEVWVNGYEVNPDIWLTTEFP